MKKISKDTQKKIEQYFLLFVIYSFIGWVMEIIIFIILEQRIINRGLLMGPYCQIYGFGFLIIDFTLRRYKEKPTLLFIMAMIISSVLEYLTSLALEIIFNVRLWDYTQNFMNLNGRICLQTTLGFGVLALIIVYKVNPILISKLDKIPEGALKYISIIIGVIMILDTCISYQIIFNIKDTFSKIGDTTSEMSTKVWEAIKNNEY